MICTLCPRRCGAVRNKSQGAGFCRLPEGMLIARIAPHLWEEPPISGSRGTGAVFFSGCTLRCRYCQNAEISHRNQGTPFTPRDLAEAMKVLEDMGMQSISLITATPFIPQILEALSIYRPHLPLVYNTSGYESVETLKMLDGVVDVYLPDFKHVSPRLAQLCTGTEDYFDVTSRAILEMVRQCGTPSYNGEGIMLRGVLIRHLILPGCTSDSLRILDWIQENLPQEIPASLMQQYTPYNNVDIPGFQRHITSREYHRVSSYLEQLGRPSFRQGPTSADEAFVPSFNAPDSFVYLPQRS